MSTASEMNRCPNRAAVKFISPARKRWDGKLEQPESASADDTSFVTELFIRGLRASLEQAKQARRTEIVCAHFVSGIPSLRRGSLNT